MKKKKRPIKIKYIVLVCFVLMCSMIGVILSQQDKLNSIQEEQQALQNDLDALKTEEQRLNRMLDYVKTDEYLTQYAREKLGYTLPGDIKLYR